MRFHSVADALKIVLKQQNLKRNMVKMGSTPTCFQISEWAAGLRTRQDLGLIADVFVASVSAAVAKEPHLTLAVYGRGHAT